MYNELVDALVANGYLHYEISNFSLPGCHSFHNSYYWDGTPYLGIGPSAHSFDGQIRRYNPSSVAEYIKMIGMSGRAYVEETETNDERYNGSSRRECSSNMPQAISVCLSRVWFAPIRSFANCLLCESYSW